MDYSFVVFNSVSLIALMYPSLSNVFMLQNINFDKHDNTIVELYVDYLVDSSTENEIIAIEESQVFEKTLIVHLRNQTNINSLRKRLSKKPKLRDTVVNLYEAYQTNVLFGKIVAEGCSKDDGLIDDEDVLDYLDSKFNQEKHADWQLLFKNRRSNEFVIIKFYSDVYMKEFLDEKKHQISNNKFIVYERCFNFNCFDAYCDEKFRKLNASEDLDFDFEILNINRKPCFVDNNTINLIDTLLAPKLKAPTTKIIFESRGEEYCFEIGENDELHNLVKRYPEVLKNLNIYLKKFKNFVVDNEDSVYIRPLEVTRYSVDEWTKLVNEQLNEFWGKNL